MRNRHPFRFLTTLLMAAGLQLGVASAALAHGDAPARFGGIVKSSQEISFELVSATAGGAEVYMDDHGELMNTTGITGKLTVIAAGGKKEAAVTADGKKLVAPGINPVSGDRVVLVVTLPSQKTVSVRYAIP